MNSGFGKSYRLIVLLALALLIGYPATAQQISSEPVSIENLKAPLVLPDRAKAPDLAFSHRFWDKKNVWLFSGIAATRVLDYTSTHNMQSRGREELLIPDDVAKNSAAFAALEVAGASTSIGVSYLLHRTGHHKMERWLSIGHISVTGFGAARNYALKSKHP